MAMLGVPLRFLGATLILGIFVIAPKVLTSFGITNDAIAFLVTPIVVIGLLVFILSIYVAPIIINPIRFIMIEAVIVIFAIILTYGLYMS